MPGQWLRTQVETGRQLSSTATTQQTATIDLPRSNMLATIGGSLRIVGVGTPTLTLDRVRVIANGGTVVWDTRGGQLRGIHKYENGSAPDGVAVSTTDLIWKFQLRFGRFPRDEKVILPARAFKSLQLQLQFTPGAGTSVTSVALDLWADEFVTDEPIEGKMFRRVTIVNTVTASANLVTKQKVPLGNFIRAFYLHADDPDNIGMNTVAIGGTQQTGNQLRVLVNNGAEIPFTCRADQLRDDNINTYRFDDADTPDAELSDAAVATGAAEMLKVDFDVDESMQHAIDSGKYNELVVEWTAAGSGTSGDTALLMEEIVVVG